MVRGQHGASASIQGFWAASLVWSQRRQPLLSGAYSEEEGPALRRKAFTYYIMLFRQGLSIKNASLKSTRHPSSSPLQTFHIRSSPFAGEMVTIFYSEPSCESTSQSTSHPREKIWDGGPGTATKALVCTWIVKAYGT